MTIKKASIDKIVYLQIAVGLFANLLVIYSVYQISSFGNGSPNFGLISSCFYSPYPYQWLVESSTLLAMLNTAILFIGNWWRTKLDIKKLVLLLIPAEINLLAIALPMLQYI